MEDNLDIISSESYGIDDVSIVLGVSLKKIITDGGDIEIRIGKPGDKYKFNISLEKKTVSTCYEVIDRASLEECLVIGKDMSIEEASTYIAASIRQGLKDGLDISACCGYYYEEGYIFDFQVGTNENNQYIVNTRYSGNDGARNCIMKIRRD